MYQTPTFKAPANLSNFGRCEQKQVINFKKKKTHTMIQTQ